MKKIISLFLCALLLLSFCSCKAEKDDGKPNIVATIFPPYDFARAVCGEFMNVEMLLPEGSESHYFEPSLSDIAKIRSADLFIYAGNSIEPWVEDVLEVLEGSDTAVLNITDGVKLLKEESVVPGSHTHSHSENDEHIWTSLKISMSIIEKIKDEICQIDPENEAVYEKNCQDYVNQLDSLDKDLRNSLRSAEHSTLVFADRFPFRYLANDYKIECFAAFSGCSSDSEPTLAAISALTGKIKENSLPCVITLETTKGSVAQKIADSAKVEVMMLHSCHNITKEQMAKKITYIDLMRDNIKVIKEALGCH